MTQWLETSFWGLSSDRHRHMFLDAATLLHGQPLQDLRGAWAALVQLDDDFEDAPDAAACVVETCIAELVASSLVSVGGDGRVQDWREAVPRCVICHRGSLG